MAIDRMINLDTQNNIVVVRVEDCLFEVPVSLFADLPDVIRQGLGFRDGRGRSALNPLILSNHPVQHFKDFLQAYIAFPHLNSRTLQLEQLLAVAELSHLYHVRALKAWAIRHLAQITTEATISPLVTAPVHALAWTYDLSLKYQRTDITRAVQKAWLLRIYQEELSATDAINFAEIRNLRHFLGHTLYLHLIQLASSSDRKGLQYCNITSTTLSPRLTKHLLSGYHSLITLGDQLERLHADLGHKAPGCSRHSQCTTVWSTRWSAAATWPWTGCPMDLFSRCQFLERQLRNDMMLDACMSASCRLLALESLSKWRERLSNNLHHHFDL
ncbi:hypothetical protein P691DRAFT_703761, partial [Macrolepiota fuliginosa MF-IS2]